MLKKITDIKRQGVEASKQEKPLTSFIKEIVSGDFAFSKAIKESPWSLIAECKLASPAKGELCSAYSVP